MLDFRMDTFLTVCQCMNYTKAAQMLNITQPAVSQHIRFLENYYQAKLLKYEGKKLALTEAGEMLRTEAVAMKQTELSLRKKILKQKDSVQSLHLGASPAVGESVMADVLQRCLEKYPEAHVSMEVTEMPQLLEKVNGGSVDFALAEGSFKKENYEFLPYSKENLIVVCSPGYRERFMEDVPKTLEELTKERIVLREQGNGTRDILERYLLMNGIRIHDFESVLEIGNQSALLQLVKNGYGITFLYECSARDLIDKGELLELDIQGFQAEQAFTFLWRKGSIYTELYRELYQDLEAAV